jgi:nucleoside-diphosphate-sugar epimerase
LGHAIHALQPSPALLAKNCPAKHRSGTRHPRVSNLLQHFATPEIGGTNPAEFVRNNVIATERLIEAALRHQVPYLVNMFSSVVNSMAIDDYTETKKRQEALVAASRIKQVILGPTLMFGWFDRKHIGWLARFMQKTPVFPVPGLGRYLRQPLFAGDFCDIITSTIEKELTGAL